MKNIVRIYEIDLYFSANYKKIIQVDKNGQQFILFRIDIYFAKYCLKQKIIDYLCNQNVRFMGLKSQDL